MEETQETYPGAPPGLPSQVDSDGKTKWVYEGGKKMSWIINKFRRNKPQLTFIPVYKASPEPSTLKQAPSWFWQAPYGVPRGVDLTEIRKFGKSTWVTMCINKIINTVLSFEWNVIPLEENVPDREISLVEEFFDDPNANNETFEHILRKVLRDVLEIDAGTIVKVFDKNKQLREIYAVNGATILIKTDKHGVLEKYYQYSFSGGMQPIEFGKDEIIYMKLNPRTDSPYGYSPLQSVLDIVKTLVLSITQTKLYFEEGNIPPGIIALTGMSQEDFERFKEYWEEEIKDKKHKLPAVNVDAKFIPFSFTLKDLQFLETQEWFSRLVMSAYGVPPSLLGFTDTVNKATSENQTYNFMATTIMPLVRLVEYHINHELIWPHLSERVQLKFTPPEDYLEAQRKSEINKTYLTLGVLTINEVRQKMGLDPVPWGDEPFDLKTFAQLGYLTPQLEPTTEEEKTIKSIPARRYGRRLRDEIYRLLIEERDRILGEVE